MPYKGVVGSAKGWLEGRTYKKNVVGSKHTFRVMDAWGMDKLIVDSLEGECDNIQVKDLENGLVYSVSFDEFKEKAKPFNFSTLQLMLPKKYFTIQ